MIGSCLDARQTSCCHRDEFSGSIEQSHDSSLSGFSEKLFFQNEGFLELKSASSCVIGCLFLLCSKISTYIIKSCFDIKNEQCTSARALNLVC